MGMTTEDEVVKFVADARVRNSLPVRPYGCPEQEAVATAAKAVRFYSSHFCSS